MFGVLKRDEQVVWQVTQRVTVIFGDPRQLLAVTAYDLGGLERMIFHLDNYDPERLISLVKVFGQCLRADPEWFCVVSANGDLPVKLMALVAREVAEVDWLQYSSLAGQFEQKSYVDTPGVRYAIALYEREIDVVLGGPVLPDNVPSWSWE